MDQKDIERSQHIKDSFSKLKENFIVLSKKDLELLLAMNKDHYYEYLSLLEVYLEKNRADETFIVKDDPKQTFEDLTMIKTPREQAAIDAASTALKVLKTDQIKELPDSEYLALLQSQQDLECQEIITAATTPFISKVESQDVVNQTFEYLELEKMWKQYGSPQQWKEVHSDGTITYRFYNLKSLDVECRARVEKDALETVKKDKFNIKYNR